MIPNFGRLVTHQLRPDCKASISSVWDQSHGTKTSGCAERDWTLQKQTLEEKKEEKKKKKKRKRKRGKDDNRTFVEQRVGDDLGLARRDAAGGREEDVARVVIARALLLKEVGKLFSGLLPFLFCFGVAPKCGGGKEDCC